MRKKGSYRKNKLFCLLAAAALRFVRSYLNDIDRMGNARKHTAAARIAAREAEIDGIAFMRFLVAFLRCFLNV